MALDNIDRIINEEYAGLPGVTDVNMQKTMKTVINNTLRTINEDAPATTSGMMDQYTPVVISLIRRVLPTLVGPQMVGMQAMNLPTGRIFVQRVYAIDRLNGKSFEVWGGAGEYGDWAVDKDNNPVLGPDGKQQMYNPSAFRKGEAGYGAFDYALSGKELGALPVTDGRHTGGYASFMTDGNAHYDANTGNVDLHGHGSDYSVEAQRPMTTHDGEELGWKIYRSSVAGGDFTLAPYPEMSFGIDAIDVATKTRKLKGRLTQEVIQDLRAVHGMDAEAELANILQAEIASEIDREIVSRIQSEAVWGARNCHTAGVFDFAIDADGRWAMEKVMSLLIQIEREATLIAQMTRRGRGNFILTSPEVAAYLSMANLITFIQNTGFTPIVNPVGTSYYGMLCNRFKVFVDPYMMSADNASHVVVVGYKGSSVYDSGLFYCPYVPIQWWKAVGEEDGGQRLGISSRYGLISNPYYVANNVTDRSIPMGGSATGRNAYFRKFLVKFEGKSING